MLIGIVISKFPEYTKDLISRPAGTMLVLIAGWIMAAFINFMMKTAGLNTGTPDIFPFSEFYGPRVHFFGLPYTILFLAVFLISLKYSERFNVLEVWITGLMLVVLGNLAQGGVEEAFYSPFDAPFYYQGIPYYQQYFHEAIKITDWKEWLSSFNIQQPHLLHHTRTHPPFAILLHYFILKISNNSLPVLACSFVFLSSLSVILIFQIMRELGLSRRNAVQFAFLFSVIPAYNIYSAVSLDGVIATMGAMFLLGLIMIMKRGFSITGLTLFASGIVFANLLTFLALFLVAAAGLVALREVLINKNCRVFLVLFISLIIMLCIQFLLKHFCEYSHVQAFMTAASLEPKSIFNYPLKYFMTRLENITMLAVFLSFGIAAVLFRPSFLNLRVFDLRNDVISMFFAGIIPILLFFLIGGLYTGEGARILLFMYPFFLLPLSNIEEPLLIFLIKAAGTQTIIMQTFGGYFW
ncbi:MAG: hypothetical protein HZB61_06600 [Nitrospirae bacterium]|nr:hypothetical protein [Nitrospirota bacterium]